jgi:hypothetical protein
MYVLSDEPLYLKAQPPWLENVVDEVERLEVPLHPEARLVDVR